VRPRWGGPALGVLLLLLAGCGSGRDSAPASLPSTTASSSPSVPPGLDTAAPREPVAQSDTAQSAVAYGRWFVQLVQYAVRTRTPRLVYGEAFDQASCSTCQQLETYIKQLTDGDYFEVGEDLRLGAFTATRTPQLTRVSGRFTYPAAEYVEPDGTKASTVSTKQYRFSARLWWDADQRRWRVRDYDFLAQRRSS
jgi:hypothetical protein